MCVLSVCFCVFLSVCFFVFYLFVSVYLFGCLFVLFVCPWKVDVLRENSSRVDHLDHLVKKNRNYYDFCICSDYKSHLRTEGQPYKRNNLT
jgi:hypothetical protein